MRINKFSLVTALALVASPLAAAEQSIPKLNNRAEELALDDLIEKFPQTTFPGFIIGPHDCYTPKREEERQKPPQKLFLS